MPRMVVATQQWLWDWRCCRVLLSLGGSTSADCRGMESGMCICPSLCVMDLSVFIYMSLISSMGEVT